MLKTACAEWYIVIQYITTRLVQIEWELENPQFRNDPRGLDASLQKLHPWRRSLPRFQEMVSEALESLSSSSGNDEEDNLWDLRHEFQRISAQLLLLQNRTEAIVNVAAAIINIEESKRAIEQNRNFARLTYLGLVFVPMSFVSSFYSMSNDISSLKDSFWIYFVTALPITVLALLVARYFMVLRDWIAKLGWDIGGVASSAERVASK
jgi:Mg2+ and Co2+ transporter CorA